MLDLLSLTLHAKTPECISGDAANFSWRWLEEGVLVLEPHQASDTALVLSAGIHGNETAPVEMLSQLLSALFNGEMTLSCHTLVVLGNPAALRTSKRYLQHDINRLFGQRWRVLPDIDESRRVARLEQAVRDFYAASKASIRWHLDMHTAIRGSFHPRFGVLPARHQPWDDGFLAWLGNAGLEALVFHRSPAGTFSHFTSEAFSALSCTLELGKAQPFGHNNLLQFAQTQRALAALLSGSHTPETAKNPPLRYRVISQITRNSRRFILHMSPSTLNFTAFPRGTVLAEDDDVSYVVTHDREWVLFPNPDVAPGLRAGLMLIKVAENTEL